MNPRIVKIGRNIIFMLSVPAIIGAFVFADVTTKNEMCSGIHISFTNNQLSFVTKENINSVIKSKGIIANKTKLRNINISQLEKSIEANKWVKNSDIFVSANNIIHIKIEQKKPVVRIQPDNDYEEPYYLDDYGNTILYSTQYVPDLPVVTSPEIRYNSSDLALKSDIVKLAKYISNDTFWNSAISQIAIDDNKMITLVPAFGNQQIILGDIKNLDYKMNKLFQFYKQGYHTINWDKYDEIDLRFERQIVCRNTRGERISVDPYDKTTHKEILAIAKAKEAKRIADSATVQIEKPIVTTTERPTVTQTKVPIVKPKQTPVTKEIKKVETDKPLVKKPVPNSEKEKTIAKNDTPAGATATKRPVKKNTEAKEIKITEVQNSKYFK